MKENKGNIVKECGTDVESLQFFNEFSYPCVRVFMKISANLSFQLTWSVEEVHVSHVISIRRMAKRLSNQQTARLIMRAGTACVMLALDEIN